MTLVDIVASIERIPLRHPFVTALRRVEEVEFVRVTLLGASGLVGFGQAPATVAITGEDCESIISTVKMLRPVLLNLEFHDIAEAMALLHGVIPGRTSAKAAVDMALYDLFAKEAGRPLYALLGGENAPVRTDVTISLGDPGAMAAEALEALSHGRTILKVKVGGRDGRDFERVLRVREAVGAEAQLLVDANQAWSEAESLEIVPLLHGLDVALVEQPVAAADLDAMRRIAAAASVPILADESAFSLEEVRRVVESGAAQMINVKLMKCGGIYKAREILEYCRSRRVACMMGSMLEGPLSIAAALHLVLAYRDVIAWCDLDSPLLYRALPASAPLLVEGTVLRVLDRPGI